MAAGEREEPVVGCVGSGGSRKTPAGWVGCRGSGKSPRGEQDEVARVPWGGEAPKKSCGWKESVGGKIPPGC